MKELYEGDMVRTPGGREAMVVAAGYGTDGDPNKPAAPAYKVRFSEGEFGWYLADELEKVP